MKFACVFAWLLTTVVAVRQRSVSTETDTESGRANESSRSESGMEVDSGIELGVGVVLRGRYVLAERIIEEYGPGKIFPQALTRQFGTATHLGTGGFGDTWKAFDSHLKKNVAVKIFYDRDRDQYLTWRTANYRQQQELKDNAQECSMVQKMMKTSDKYPEGASRICQCFEEHVMDAKNTDKPVFLVLEMCGRELAAILSDMAIKGKADVGQARHLIKQAIQGIAFIEKQTPALIHHDLKPGNLVVDGDALKIIDWGGAITTGDQFGSAAYTPVYAAPEVLEGQGRFMFSKPPHSYDVYALGLIYLELICPKVSYKQWFDMRKETHYPLTEQNITKLIKSCPAVSHFPDIGEDVKLISRMVSRKPADRPAPLELLEVSPLGSKQVAPVDAQAIGKHVVQSTTLPPRGGGMREMPTTTNHIQGLMNQLQEGRGKITTTLAPGGPKFRKGDDVILKGHAAYIANVRFQNGHYMYDVNRKGGGNLPLKYGALADELVKR